MRGPPIRATGGNPAGAESGRGREVTGIITSMRVRRRYSPYEAPGLTPQESTQRPTATLALLTLPAHIQGEDIRQSHDEPFDNVVPPLLRGFGGGALYGVRRRRISRTRPRAIFSSCLLDGPVCTETLRPLCQIPPALS